MPIHVPDGIDEEHFDQQFPNHEHYSEPSNDEPRPDWWEIPKD